MVFSVFNNTKEVNVDDLLIHEYEKQVAPVDFHRIEYFIASSGADINSANLDEVVLTAIKEELAINEKLPSLIEEAKKCL